MIRPEDATAVVRLGKLGWGSRRIARELGIARNPVRGYLRAGEWRPNAVVVHRELESQHKITAASRSAGRLPARGRGDTGSTGPEPTDLR
jgi:predicted transcriptional regulator